MTGLSGDGIVLASNSASRKAMLEAAGIAFEAKGADVDERAAVTPTTFAEPPAVPTPLTALAHAAPMSHLIRLPFHAHAPVLGRDVPARAEGARLMLKRCDCDSVRSRVSLAAAGRKRDECECECDRSRTHASCAGRKVV